MDLRTGRVATKLKMGSRNLNGMRYWAYLAAKLLSAAAVFYGLLGWIVRQFPRGVGSAGASGRWRADFCSTTLAVLGWFLLCAGVLTSSSGTKRYRCRICLRRLRMPVETGSWGRMLQFGRPRIEYICPYGHGTLKQGRVANHRTGKNPQWDAAFPTTCGTSCAPPARNRTASREPRARVGASRPPPSSWRPSWLSPPCSPPSISATSSCRISYRGWHSASKNRTNSDDVLRTWVLDKAHALDLPVKEENVQVIRSREGVRIDVRYFVRVHAARIHRRPAISTPAPAAAKSKDLGGRRGDAAGREINYR